MKEFLEDSKTALKEIATIFLFVIPSTCKNERVIAKTISKK